MKDKVFFDTNILVYANDTNNQIKQDIASELIKAAMLENTAVISVQVLSEFWVTVTQKIEEPLPVAIAEHQIEILGSMKIVDLDYSIFRDALKIQKMNKLSYWDSLIISAANSAGCGIMYSEDLNDGQKIMDLTIVNPFK